MDAWRRSPVLAGGPNPDYEMGGNPTVKHGADGGGFIRSVVAQPKVPGMLQAGLAAGSYVRKRVRLSGYLRTEDVSEVLTIWMGIQGQNTVLLAVADGGRSRGTTGWKKHDVVLDVPEQSVTLSLGITLEGTGKVWLDGVTVDTVGHEVAVTAQKWAFGGGAGRVRSRGDPAVERGSERGAFIRSKVQAPKKAAALTMAASPVPYLGNASGCRVSQDRGRGEIRRTVDDCSRPERRDVGFRQHGQAADQGHHRLEEVRVVLDVPRASAAIGYGIMMEGAGKVWLDGVALEVVGEEVPVTDGKGWFTTGSNPEDYAMGGYPAEPHGGRGGAFVRSAVAEPRTFGSWATSIDAEPYLGKRLRLSAYVRTEDVANEVGLWMRVDGPTGVLTFDNMENRAIKGTTDWKKHDVVLDVPATAAGIMYGLVLQGKGSAWFDGLTLEPVDTSVAATGGLDPFTEDYAGHYAEAAKRFPDLIARRPASFTPRLFNFLALHRSGQMDDARTYIASVADGLADRKWAAPVALFYAGRLSEDEVLKAAASTDPASTGSRSAKRTTTLRWPTC